MADEGKIEAIRVSRQRRVTAEEVKRFLKEGNRTPPLDPDEIEL